jgi:tetratricopeptide (TPR) repeat protein
MALARWARALGILFAALAVLAVSPRGAAAVDKDDFEFARGLLKRRWYDLAEKVFRELSQKGDSQDLKNKGDLGLIDVLKKRAEDESDAAAKKKYFEEAIAKYKDFLKGKTDPQALFNLAELLKTKGTEFTTQIRLAEKEEDKKNYEKEAATAFEEAVGLLKDFIEKMEKVKADKGGELENLTEEEQEQLRNAMFSHADLHLLMGKVYEGQRDKKIEALKKADELFEKFIWEFEDYGQAWLGYLKRGQCQVEMEEFGKALDLINTILLSEEEEGLTAQGKTMRMRLRAMAYYRYLEALVLAGKKDPKKYEEALTKAAQMEAEYKNVLDDTFADPDSGRMAILEKAKALAGLGKYTEAILEAVRVVDKGGDTIQFGMKLLGEWVAQDPTVGPRINLLQAEGLFKQAQHAKAIAAYQDALDKLASEKELQEHAPKAWKGLAEVYASREQFFEAALAWLEAERVAQVFLKGGKEPKDLWDVAAQSCYEAYRNYKFAYERGTGKKSEYIANIYRKQVTALTSRYPDSPWAKNLLFFSAQDKLKAGDYLGAIEDYRRVDPVSEYYEFALVGIGQAWFKEYERMKTDEVAKQTKAKPDLKAEQVVLPPETLAVLDKARESLEAYQKLAADKKVEGDEAEARRRLLNSLSTFFLGRVWDEKADWKKVLETLGSFEEKYKEDLNLVTTACFLRLRAHYQLKEARPAEDMLRLMEEADGKYRDKEEKEKGKRPKVSQYVIIGYQFVGNLYSDLAAKAKAAHEPEAYRENNEKSAEFLLRWIEADILGGENLDPSKAVGRLDAVGIKLFNAKNFDKASLLYDVILKKFGDGLDENQLVRYSRALGNCYMELKEWEKARDIYLELYEKKKTPLYIESLVVIYTKLGDKYSDEGQVKKANETYDEALKLYTVIMREGDQPDKKSWWEQKLSVWNILYKKGEYSEVVMQVQNAELLYPTLGGPALKEAIKALQNKAKERAKK